MPDNAISHAPKKALIVGGGIGGLAAALSLARQGLEVEVLEQAPEFGEVGAGMQLSPNCTRVLFDLGLEEALRAVAFLPEGSEMRDWKSGRVVTAAVFGEAIARRYGFPYLHIHRADLIDALVSAARDEPGISLNAGCAVTAVSEGGGLVRAAIGDSRTVSGDILIGADGIGSVVCDCLFGGEEPAFTGNVAWRALVPAARLPEGLVRPMATVWWGPGAHFVHYYVRQGELVNCVCVKEKAGWEIESWTEPGEREELKSDFRGWHKSVQLLIDNMDGGSLYKWALFDRPPMPAWGRGRITLLGDACHPTLPFMAQGAAMAIEDGAVLARCLRRPAPVAENLRAYESLRRRRTAGVQRGSRWSGKVFHMRGMGAWLRNRAAARASGSAQRRLFGYNALRAHEQLE